MRRWLAVVVVSVVGILGFLAPPADAQTPKVTINGLVDQVTGWNRNMSQVDSNYDRTDSIWYARTRVRPDITAEVGTTKFVLGIEIDASWGQFGAQDTNACIGTACPSANPQRFGVNGGWDLNTDTIGLFELKWAYTEFDIPWVPGARMRLGAQPWAATYKSGTLATGDFAGANFTWAITPAIRANLTYAQIEEQSQEAEAIDGSTTGLFSQGLVGGARNEDYAFVASVEVTPFKGLDIRPIYSYARFEGPTSGSSRQGRGGVGTGAPTSASLPLGGIAIAGGTLTGTVGLPGYVTHDIESRHTIGVDARLRLGPFSIDPTFLYQFGSRDVGRGATALTFTPAGGGAPVLITDPGGSRNQDISAFLADVIAGFQAGPLLLEGRFSYGSGNKASDNLITGGTDVNHFQTISTDSGWWGTWSNITALSIDYLQTMYTGVGGLNPANIGYDKYGLMRLAGRASYALTPTFTAYGIVGAHWTAESVDVNSVLLPAVGIIPTGAIAGNSDKESYLGTEINLGFTWRLAPNLAFDLVGAYMFTGDALGYAQQVGSTAASATAPCPGTGATTGTCLTVNSANTSREPEDIKSIAARFRFTF
jgi:hypothetical protein